MTRILVIMATYNGEKYLSEQMDSIFNQKEVTCSVLVRDDGSKDNTLSILKNYQRDQDLTWYQGSHAGVADGYYELMEKASSGEFFHSFDYIAFSDQDDVWDNDKLITAAVALRKMSDNRPALYYCGQRLTDEKLNIIGDHTLNSERSLKTRFVLSDFAGCTGVFNKKLLLEVVSYKPKYMLMHDSWILRVCLAIGGTVIVDPEAHMCYRQHGNNTLGLEHSLRADLKQVNQYLNMYHIEPLMKELKNGYRDKLVEPYREIIEWICDYRTNREHKKKLLDKSNVDFCNRGLNLTYQLKVRLNKL